MTTVQQGIESARAGTNPGLICRMPSGWAVLCDLQYLRGYTLLLPDPSVPSLNDLEPQKRSAYLCDMALIGDALLGDRPMATRLGSQARCTAIECHDRRKIAARTVEIYRKIISDGKD